MFVIQSILLYVVMSVVLIVVLRRLIMRHATTATAHLQDLSEDYLKRQEELKKRLEEAERSYQEQLAKAQEEAQTIKSQALKEAELARQQALEQARQEAERIIQQANQAREHLQQELTQSLETRAVDYACGLLQRILPEALRGAAHAQWVDALIQNGTISVDRLETQEDVREARVVSACALTADQRARLLKRLDVVLKHPVTLEESVDPCLIAGLTITIGHLVLDGSLGSKLREAARHADTPAK